MIKLDLKKFKHLKSDDKTVTLEHADGHTLCIATGKLSKAMQAQLNALKEHTKQSAKEPTQDTQMYAQGGKVEKYADGGDVKPLDEALKFDPTAPLPPAPTPEETFQSKVNEYAQTFPNQPPEVLERSAIRDMREQQQAVNAGAEDRQAAEAAAKYKQEYDQEIKHESDVIVNKNRASVGLPAEPVTPMPEAGGLMNTQPAAPAGVAQGLATPTTTSTISDTDAGALGVMQSGYNKEMAGIQQEGKAKAALADEQAKLYQDAIASSQKIKQDYDTRYQELETERKAFMDDIKNGHINPDKYWDNHSRVAAGIGMILAGFTPSQAPNAAADFLEKQMEMNIRAQEKNLDSKNNLLAANMKQFGNLNDAMNMTRVMQADMVNNQLMNAAAKANNPLAKAAALKAAGELQQKYAPLVQKLAEKQTLAKITTQANQDPKQIPAMLAAVRQLDPEKAKDLEARMIPGVGFAPSLEGAKGIREMGATTKVINDSVTRLKEILKRSDKTINPVVKAEADSLRKMLVGQLRVPMMGPGTLNDGERQALLEVVPEVTSLMSLDASSLKRLDTIADKVNSTYKNQLIMHNLDPNKVPGLQSEQDKIKRLQELRQKAGK